MKRIHSLASRYFLLVVAVLFPLGVLGVATDTLRERRDIIFAMEEELSHLRDAHIPTIELGLSIRNAAIIQEQLDLITRYRQIAGVSVQSVYGSFFFRGNLAVSGLIHESIPLTYRHAGREQSVGSLVLYIDRSGLRIRLRDQAIFLIVLGFVGVVAAAVSVSVLFRTLVGRHLTEIARFLSDSTESTEPFRLNRRTRRYDELRVLVDSVNSMRSGLHGRIREKELQVREIQHRVKNDMNLVSSLLQVQAAGADSTQISEALNTANARIFAVSQVYNRLFRATGTDLVELSDFLSGMTVELKASTIPESVSLSMATRELFVPSEIAVSVGIIVNELVTNACKYAFHGIDEPHLEIATALDGDLLTLIVRDNGVGMDAAEQSRSAGFGYSLLESFASVHGGRIDVQTGNGTTVNVTFRISPPGTSTP